MKTLKASDIELTQSSDYLTDAFYQGLLDDREQSRNLGPCVDFDLVKECEALLHYEARLMDEYRYKDWLDLYTKDAIYWVPYDDNADIRTHVNLMFDDRRRLEDRILRLLSKFAHTLSPDRSFQHHISNVEAWELPDGRRKVLSKQIVYEYRTGHEIARHVYSADHTLKQVEGVWKVAVKRSVLLNITAAVEPPTLL